MNETPFDVPGGWTRRSFELTGHTFELLLPADPDQVLEEQLETEANDQMIDANASADPYWAALWSSALPTAEAVVRESWRSDVAALELGCGMGLVGIAALASGMGVTFSDHVAQAVQLALENARRNGFHRAQGLQLDWHQPVTLEDERRFSVILASDILYNRANHLSILSAINQLLAPDGICWIGDPGRYNSREFLKDARQHFRVELRDQAGNAVTSPLAGQYQRFVLRR